MKKLMLIALIALMVFSLFGCAEAEETKAYKSLPTRFVQVDEELICADYRLDVQQYYADGTKQANDNEMCYIVDRVSRLVYIYIENTGSYDSGLCMMPCPDANGNHMRYEGELPE